MWQLLHKTNVRLEPQETLAYVIWADKEDLEWMTKKAEKPEKVIY